MGFDSLQAYEVTGRKTYQLTKMDQNSAGIRSGQWLKKKKARKASGPSLSEQNIGSAES